MKYKGFSNFLTPFLCCNHVFCAAESIDDELAVLMVQKKHTYKLTVSPVSCSDRIVNILTVKEANSQAKQVTEKSRACVCFPAKHMQGQILHCTTLALIPDGMS